ncbi:MAG: PucR family transcriptional regulator [Pseudoclavibacter sp.]
MKWLEKLRPTGAPWDLEGLLAASASSPRLLVEGIDLLGMQPVAWIVEMSARINVAVDERERSRGYPTSHTGRSRPATERAFFMLLMSIRGGGASYLADGLPDELRAIVRADVRHGIPLEVLMNRVWSVHSVAKETLTETVRAEVTVDELVEVLAAINESAFDFANVFVRLVASTYEEEQRAWRRRRSDEQREIIERVIAGGEPPDACDATLSANWSGVHLCGVAWLDVSAHGEHIERELADYGAQAAGTLDVTNVFAHESQGLTHFWWNAPPGSPRPDPRSLEQLERPNGVRIAIGSVGRGVDGLRESYVAALQAATLRHWPSPYGFVLADDIAHLTMLLADRDAALAYVRRELGALAGAEMRLAEIRETVRLYLSGGNSRIAVAKTLHLAPNTIAYRVGQASELLGRPVGERPTQVLLALQLVDLVPALLDMRTDADPSHSLDPAHASMGV